MTTVTISLPEPLREFVDRQVKKKSYGDASEYFRELLMEAQEREAREHRGTKRTSVLTLCCLQRSMIPDQISRSLQNSGTILRGVSRSVSNEERGT
jgi:putative addiction module CopG family antidote